MKPRRNRRPPAQVRRAYSRVLSDMLEQGRSDIDRGAERDPAGYTVKRSVSCEAGFLGAAVVQETFRAQPEYADKGGGLTLITGAQALRNTRSYPGPVSELGSRLADACARLPAEHEGRIGNLGILTAAPERGAFRVVLVPDEELWQTLRDERGYLHSQIGQFALGSSGYLPHVTLWATSNLVEAEHIREQLDVLRATEAPELILGAPFLKPIYG